MADITGKILNIRLTLKAHQVIGKQRADQPFMLRHSGQNQRRRQGNVQKEADAVLQPIARNSAAMGIRW